MLRMVSAPKNIDALKHSIKTLWQMENELRYSAWSALTLDKEKAQAHLSEARRHLNLMLNEVDPVDHVPDQPPAVDPKK
ncbi:MAG: hypothetical protein Q7T86_06800 [Hyphomicrobiaceae bacterium]|nr:hypothetical protein [Hyphomicrobiaceae bacterium]